ncbi:unnamed protein product [Parajaminaea phylloscopi]
MASSVTTNKASWPARYEAIQRRIADPRIQAVLEEVTTTPHVRQCLAAAVHSRDRETAGIQQDLDLALEALWSSSRLEQPDRNQTRIQALPKLRQLSAAALSASDFPNVTSLQRSAAGHVEIVRSRFDRQLYVLKTVVKGLAKRERQRCNPSFEVQLLAEGQRIERSRRPVPDLVASFQSQHSLHVVMQYFPAGDLDQLLHSAGQAGTVHGFGHNGRLLDESYIRAYATDIVAAVAWCHEQGFAHRDVKPANFLLDRSGHLKLCDFATAAPFATFGPSQKSPSRRRRVLWQYSCLSGTPDYIAPDILLGEETRINRLAKSACSSFGSSWLDESSWGMTKSSACTLPAPDSEGLYGPEVDWWSVGVVLYEMIYKDVPFWAESIREAHHRICNHEQYLRFDANVPVSSTLQALVQSFLTKRETRLGHGVDGSDRVKRHPFFAGVDWFRYLDTQAPFIPNVEPAQPNNGSVHDHVEQEPSVIHSPRVMPGRQTMAPLDESHTMTPESIHLSQMFTGDPNDFPLFGESPEQGLRAVLPDFQRTPAVWTTVSADNEVISPQALARISSWSDVEVSWIGFSRLPSKDGFTFDQQALHAPLGEGLGHVAVATPAQLRRRASCASVIDVSPASSTASASPEQWFNKGADDKLGPVTSTPYARPSSTGALSPVRPSLSPPAISALTPAVRGSGSLQRKAVTQASRQGVTPDGRYNTPLRKASLPNIASAFAERQPVLPCAGEAVVAPLSPYPFPMAATPAPLRMMRHPRFGPSMRHVSAGSFGAAVSQPSGTQPRASESPYSRIASMGSDSRCSGGSNAKRDFSENEAMEQLEVAVLQSARKVRIEHQEQSFPRRLAALEEKVGVEYNVRKPVLSHSRTAPALPTEASLKDTHPVPPPYARRTSAPSISIEGASPHEKKRIPPAMDPHPQQAVRPAASTLRSHGLRPVYGRASDRRRPVVDTPLVIYTSLDPAVEESEGESDSMPTSPGVKGSKNEAQTSLSAQIPGPAPQSDHPQPAPAAYQQGLKPPSQGERILRTRRSDRQLKLEAQERTTPTRPTRVNSPLFTTEFDLAHLSLGPPTPLEERANPADAFQSRAVSVSDSCRTPELTDSNDSEGSNSGDSLRTNTSSDMQAAGKGFDLHSFYGAVPVRQGAGVIDPKNIATRLSAPTGGLTPGDAGRLRSRSHSQLPKLHHLSLGVGANDLAQATQAYDCASRGPMDERASSANVGHGLRALGADSARAIRRKDSREMLKEYRNSARLSASPCLPTFPEDAFGGAPLPLNLGAVAPLSSTSTHLAVGKRASRRSSTTNLNQQFGSMSYRPREVTASHTEPQMLQGPQPNALRQERRRPSSNRASKHTEDATETPSPLTKMDHRLNGLQSSVFGLQNRISKLKAKLHD